MEAVLTKKMTVGKENLASFVGSGSLDVLATPAVAALMEGAASELAQSIVGEGYTTVGTKLCLEHTSPSPLGAEITAEARLTKSDGRKFEFEIIARDNLGEIARADHTRVSVDSVKFQKKADNKYEGL